MRQAEEWNIAFYQEGDKSLNAKSENWTKMFLKLHNMTEN